jgi:hypothetical protein
VAYKKIVVRLAVRIAVKIREMPTGMDRFLSLYL